MSVDTDQYNNPLNAIVKMLDDKFNEAELTFICAELFIDFADFEGNMLKRCQSLVDKLAKENKLEDLLDVIEKENLSLQSDLENIRRGNNRSQEGVSSPSNPTSAVTSVAEIVEPIIEEDTPEPTPTDIIEPTNAIIETAVPESTPTTEPEPTAVIESTDTPTSVPIETPIPTETPIPLPELGLLSTINREKDNQLMFYVPAGSFQMGASSSDTFAQQDESPIHEVTLAAFWIDKSEVTNQQYQLCIDEGPCRPVASAGQQASEKNYPRVNVTWEDALAYCEWVDRDGTLPTEAQWEYAARGTDARIYPWGNEAPACQRANYGECNNYRPKPVESSPRGASWSGALDMSGNVYEWVSDWYSADFYKNSPINQPINMIPSYAKVRRGGSYFHQSDLIRATNRDSLPPEKSAGHTGFRCVVNITE